MDLTNYCVIAGVSLLFLVGCLAHLSENDIFSGRRIERFRRVIYCLMFETAIDCAFVLLLAHKAPVVLLYIIKEIEMLVNPTLAFLVFDVFYDKKMLKNDKTMQKLCKVIQATIIANIITQSLAIFGLNVFYIDKNSGYRRGPLVYVYVLLLLVGIVALEYGMFVFSRKTQSTMIITLLSFTALLLTSILLRAFFNDNNYDFLCLAASAPFLLIYYSHVTLRVDPVTRLLNRQVYSTLVKKVNYSTVVIMIDINNLKQINDGFGHKCGDQTLKRIADTIRKTYGQYAYCFRIGGDEFCAIWKPDVFDKLIEKTPYHDAYSMAEKFMSRLDVAVKTEAEKVGSEAFMQYGVSQGYGIFYSQTDYPDATEQMPFEDVIKTADDHMYRNKESFKQNHPEINDSPRRITSRPKVFYRPSSIELAEQNPDVTNQQQDSSIENVDHANDAQV